MAAADDAAPLRPLPPHLDPRQQPQTRSMRGSRSQERASQRKGRRLTVVISRALAALLSIVILAGAGVATTAVNRINSKSATAASPEDVSGNVEATDVTGTDTGEDLNILVVGNDSRQGYTDEQLAQLGAGYDVTLNTDTLMLIHVPADGSRASIVSFPRDSLVKIPGYGSGKINSAYAAGYYSVNESAPAKEKAAAGQAELITTMSQLTGLKIDHYVEVTMLGFLKLTEQLKGITVTLCDDTSDPQYTGLELSKGTHTLMGADALRFVRQRHGLPNGDLDRIKRQQYFFGAVIRKMLGQNFLGLIGGGKLNSLIDALAGTIAYDPGLNPLQLAEQMREVGAGNVEFRTVPLDPAVYGDIEGIGSVILLADDADLKSYFRNLNASLDAGAGAGAGSSTSAPAPPLTVAPQQVTVDVFNGTGTGGVGISTTDALAALGFVINTTNTAEAVQTDTTVGFAPGMEAEANTLLAQVPGAILAPDATVPAGTVRLVLGSTFTGLAAAPGATTAPPPPDFTAAAGGCVN